MRRRLTGNYYFKQTWRGLILMVGIHKVVCDFAGDDSPDIEVFRKAILEDLIHLKL